MFHFAPLPHNIANMYIASYNIGGSITQNLDPYHLVLSNQVLKKLRQTVLDNIVNVQIGLRVKAHFRASQTIHS